MTSARISFWLKSSSRRKSSPSRSDTTEQPLVGGMRRYGPSMRRRFNFDDRHLSRQRPRVRIPSSPPYFSSAANKKRWAALVQPRCGRVLFPHTLKTSCECQPSESSTTCRYCCGIMRSEEHTSELQSPYDLVCRLLL